MVVGLGAAACGGEDESSSLPKVTVSASATPSASPSAEPTWSATAKPERPEDEQSAAGAQAFAEFAADTVFYMMATSDVPAMTSISDLATCESCKSWDDDHNAGKVTKKSILSGPVTYRLADKPLVNDEVFYQVTLLMDIPRGKSVTTQDDGSKKSGTLKAEKALPFKADLQWKDDQWLLMRYRMG